MLKKVLIIEDNPDLQEIYTIFFESAGWKVYIAGDGMQGIIDVLEVQPDVILLDIMMPQMDGFEVLTTIKEQSSIDIPIIVASNLSQKSDEERALDLGASKFLIKSDYSGEQIVEEVLKYVE